MPKLSLFLLRSEVNVPHLNSSDISGIEPAVLNDFTGVTICIFVSRSSCYVNCIGGEKSYTFCWVDILSLQHVNVVKPKMQALYGATGLFKYAIGCPENTLGVALAYKLCLALQGSLPVRTVVSFSTD